MKKINKKFKVLSKIIEETTDYVDINVRYIKDLYDDFNKKYFNNELGNYPIEIKPLKRVFGKVKTFRSSDNVKLIQFSNLLKQNEDQIKGTVLHEMIHVYLFEKGIKHKHGRTFLNELEKLQKQTNFKIPISEYAEDYTVDYSKTKEREKIAVITHDLEGIMIFNKKLKRNFVENFEKIILSKAYNLQPIIVLTKNKEIEKYKIKRKIETQKVKIYKIDKELSEEIIENGEILKDYRK